ncbi:MmcQ/YjbR family DNA-binding protein [Pedobacter sp. SYP-B3415]|uniref:MmcQ/YjbR family DNA-binding protein n=1 Tax=Pedobacter sp. SYP-B3415 TaxID=2496641 RepID=UPI00101CD611|nr:MmcQ/YjbR family DNA-binding protein [Pedobacter sp. SYP-B3415]
MDIETFRDFCLGLPGTTEDVKWGDHLCFLVENKIYIMCSLTAPHAFSFKIEPEAFDELIKRTGVLQAPYSAKRQWALAESLDVFPEHELQSWVANSRRLVISKLTKKLQAKYL